MSAEATGAAGNRARLRDLLRRVLTEQLEPGRAAAAVALGVTFGILPIWGLQSVVAIALATAFRLNRPLTLAATFINNPVLQPFLVVGALQLGHLALHGSWAALSLSPRSLTARGLGDHLLAFVLGSLLLSALLSSVAAALTYAVLRLRGTSPAAREERRFRAFVNERFRGAAWYARGFVRWKTRLDRLFALLLAEDLGQGPAVDLGCGHGTALALLAWRDPGRRLHGCDLDPARVEAARTALAGFPAELEVADARRYPVPPAGLVLILDVLQYLAPAEQAALLRRCAEALLPGGRLLLRMPDPGRGMRGGATRGLDRLVVGLTGGAPPRCDPEDCARVLEEAGLRVERRRYRNRLPLAHVVLTATRPGTPA